MGMQFTGRCDILYEGLIISEKGRTVMKRLSRIRNSMTFNIIGVIVLLLIFFGTIVATIGFYSFTYSFKKEYSTTTFHMADTATTLINGDHLDEYLKGEEKEEYDRSRRYLDGYCKRIGVSLIYIIVVDRSDYGRFVSVFNAVDNSVDDTKYTIWELGHKRETTNDEYRKTYQQIYDKEILYGTIYRTHPPDGIHPHITTLVPVHDSNDEVSGILCIQRPIRELKDARRPYLITIMISTILLSLFAAIFVTSYLTRQVVKPIKMVSKEATRFAMENTKGEPFENISEIKEISGLAHYMHKMETDMLEYIENITEITAEKERIGAELSLARNIQISSIPNEFPPFPDRKEFDIFASMTPAKEVGGDLYNFFLIDDDHLAIVIGDVSGKGIPAALFMMVSNILIMDWMHINDSPAEVMNSINDIICARNAADMFVTLWLGILEISTGRIIACNAGHEDAVIYRKNGDFTLTRTKHDLVVGALPGIKYHDYEITLNPGDKLFIYTDGATEATDNENRMYTLEKVVETLNKVKDGSPREIVEGLHRSLDEFVAGAPQFDDITLLCIELKEV